MTKECGFSPQVCLLGDLASTAAASLKMRTEAITYAGAAVLVVGLACLAWHLLAVFTRWLRHYTARRGSSFTAIATTALKELHAHKPQLYPPTPHEWYTAGSNAPASLVCCSCFKPVIPGGQSQCCELCGSVAHFTCCRGVPPNCKPWSLPEGRHGHDWRPTGTRADQSQDVSSMDITAMPSLCLMCGDPCEVGLFAVEPVWGCSGCKRQLHCQCYAHTHPDCFSSSTLAALRCVSAAGDPDAAAVRGIAEHSKPQRQKQPQKPQLSPRQVEATKGKQSQQHLQQQHQQQQPEVEQPSVRPKPLPGVQPLSRTVADAAVRACSTPRQPSSPAPRTRGSGAFSSRPEAESELEMKEPVGNRSISSGGWVSATGRRRKSSACAMDLAGDFDHAPSSQCQQRQSLDRQVKNGAPLPSSGNVRPCILPPSHITSPCEVVESITPSPLSSPSHRKCLSLSCMSDALDGGGGGWASPTTAEISQHTTTVHAAATAPPTLRNSSFHPASPVRSLSCSALAASHQLTETQLALLDECRDGLHACVILPASAVRLRNTLPTPLAPTAPIVSTHVGGSTTPGHKPASPVDGTGTASQPAVSAPHKGSGVAAVAVAPAAGARKRGKHSGGLRKGATAAAKRWWGSDRTVTKWQHFAIDNDAVPLTCKPVLVFVNLKSGPQVGHGLRRQLLQLLHPLQVVELPRESPDEALMCWAGVPRLRLLVVGGDGTVGWVLSALERVAVRVAAAAAAAHSAGSETGGGSGEGVAPWVQPPLAMLPLGTGNDLARCLNWGGGLGSVRSRGLDHCLLEVALAQQVQVDRWRVCIEPQVVLKSRRISAQHTSRPQPAPAAVALSTQPRLKAHSPAASAAPPAVSPTPGSEMKSLNNYLGVGIDAQCALEFHAMRERYPAWFTSQIGNKVWYGGVGAKDLIGRTCVDLPRKLTVLCDGVPLVIPSHLQGLLFLNISSFMGGVELWQNGVPSAQELLLQQQQQHQHPLQGVAAFRDYKAALGRTASSSGLSLLGGGSAGGMGSVAAPPQSLQDGLMEVVGVNGAVHLGQLQMGLARAQRLSQCSVITLITHEPVQMQIDGEPWMQPPATLTITLQGRVPLLQRQDVSHPGTKVATAVSEALDAVEFQGVITSLQRRLLETELSERLSSV